MAEKREALKEEINATQGVPLINGAELKSPEPVYERLYKLAAKTKPDEKEEKPSQESLKKQHRGKPIYEALSELHSLREAKQQIRNKKALEDEKKTLEKEAEDQKLKVSEEMSHKKFLKEFGKVLKYMEFHEKDFDAENPDLRLSFHQMGGLLTTMGFINSELLPVHTDF